MLFAEGILFSDRKLNVTNLVDGGENYTMTTGRRILGDQGGEEADDMKIKKKTWKGRL